MASQSQYDPFAWVYNKHWSDFYRQVFPLMENLVLRRLPPKASILDLCCGTGQLAHTLATSGYEVTGLDSSVEMLHFARENAPQCQFIAGDARRFKLPATYHAVVSIFDSLNHIMALEELAAVFRNVYSALISGGIFFFDLNTEAGYQTYWHDSFGVVEEELVCVVRSHFQPEDMTARFETTIFYLQEGWQRQDVTIRQKCYRETEVVFALKAAGFKSIQACARDEQHGVRELTEAAERMFFTCRKGKEG